MSLPTPSDSSEAAVAPAAADPQVGRKMAKGAGWTVAARLSVQAIGFMSTIILARLLVPEDFGLVALATTFYAGLQALTEFTFDAVLIQNRRAGRAYYDTAWTLQVARNTFLGLFMAAGASVFAALLGDARIEDILYCLAAVALVEGFQNIGIVEFRKHFKFHLDFLYMVVSKLAMIVVAVPLALTWGNYWALVAGIAAGGCTRVALSYAMQGYRPRLALTKWRAIIRFSKWLLLTQAGTFFFQRSDTFVIGRILGAQSVGVYAIAYELANLTTSTLLAPIRRAAFPGFAAVAANAEGLRRSFVDIYAFALLIATPTAVGIGLVAEPLVHVALGLQWLESIPLIRILALYGFFSVASAGSGPVMMALGRPHLMTYILATSIVVLIPSLIVGTLYAGVVGTAWAATFTALVMTVLNVSVAARLIKLRLLRLWLASWRPLIAIAVMAAVVLSIEAKWPTPSAVTGWLALLLVCAGAGATTYLASIGALWSLAGRPDGAEQHLLVAVRDLSRRFLKRQPTKEPSSRAG